uniref:Myosin motor domain-containing protein n=1 Tax=Seriola lalandi dorsalis TaxID=1841481 RepID=A0A3B4XUM8_SERLL
CTVKYQWQSYVHDVITMYLCNLPVLNEDRILNNLRTRFYKKKIYTYAGSILIAINPFKFLPIYNPKYATEGVFMLQTVKWPGLIANYSSLCLVTKEAHTNMCRHVDIC